MATIVGDWTEGYVAEVEYTSGFYQELSPALLSFVLLLRGHQAPAIDRPFTCFELGCGKGVSANLIAAAIPNGRFYANDFNPAHVVAARTLAEEAGTSNLTFLERSFAELSNEDLPEFDFITLHGVYSWVSDENRRAIVDFIRRKLKPGGLVYISYNCLPGWAAAAPIRELMLAYAADQTGALTGRIKAAIEMAKKLRDLKAKYFASNPEVGPRLDRLATQAPNYLAHEYFNKDWTLLYHADVARDMAGAKLGFLGSASFVRNFDDMIITPDAKGLVEKTADPVLRETLKDFLINEQFRRDVFVRGAPRLDPARRTEAWKRQRFALRVSRSDCAVSAKVPVGTLKMSPGHERILDALAEAPRTLQELLVLPEVAKGGSVMEITKSLSVLVAVGYVAPALPQGDEEKRRESASRLNNVILGQNQRGESLPYLTSPVTGNGLSIDRADQLFLEARRRNRSDLTAFAWDALSKSGQVMVKAGKPLQGREENVKELATRAASFTNKRLPLYTLLGIV